ncbi:MAG: VWA domain-containing protein [Paludisphaera borealis]|uniref:VWA domain-containing protein n=1 Tax=Paludisphaera borealis TaxID=1387353 RepID=UPI0028475C23|nr:VWA domain-containing protein [Paludisphaera borealis]MDR3617743.1 VWA domain-containing protein [Paludisphaera borealis]
MNRFWQYLLGIEPTSPGVVSGVDSHLEFASLPRGLGAVTTILGALVLIALIWRLYRWERRELSATRRALLVGLRMLTIAAVGVMLLEPVLVSTRREQVRSHLAMILDDSESMKFSDPYTDDAKAAEIAAKVKMESAGGKSPVALLRETPRLGLVQKALGANLDALGRGRDLFVYDLETAARPGAGESARSRKLDDVQAKRPISPLGDALQGVLAAHRGQPVAGLILATDGRSNTGEDPIRAVQAAARQNIPIYAIAAGADEGPRNIRVAEVEASPVVFVRDPMTLAVVIEARGLRDAEATVVLEQRANDGPWEPAGSQRVVLGEDGILKRSTFRIIPKAVGQYEYRAKVEDAGPELTMDDNVASAAVRVVRQQIRVLLIAGGPSPEVQFLRNALMRDQHVEFAGWMQHVDPGFRQPGDRPITRLPNNDEELRRYDALLLVDPDIRAMGAQWPAMIQRFIGQEGGGLIFVAGELFSQQLFEAVDPKAPGGDWTRILPVVRDPGLYRSEAEVRLSSQNTYSLDLTPEGRGDPVFEFNADPIRNRAVLTSLPGMYWSFPVTRARPGATILARHGDPRMANQNGRHVLLASQFYGPGRTVFIGFDSTYRWRYIAEDFFDGFWARLVDRVGRSKALGGRFPFQVHLGKSLYRVGERVSIGVRYSDPTALAEAAELTAELEVAGQPPEPLRFEKSPDDPAVLTAAFPAQQAGAYSLRIVPAASSDLGDVKVSTTTFRVEPPRREIDEPALNRTLLADLARMSGGRVFELSDVGQLDEAIPMREVTRTLETRDELWDAPLLYATIILALTVEWVLRKLFRMV